MSEIDIDKRIKKIVNKSQERAIQNLVLRYLEEMKEEDDIND